MRCNYESGMHRSPAKRWRAGDGCYGASSLDFETAYYVLVPDHDACMHVQKAINVELVGGFETEGIELAYPTQTLYVRSQKPEASGPAPIGPSARGRGLR